MQAVLDEVAPLAAAFSAAGRSLYLVGGIVRDLQLGAPIEALDFDLTTEAEPAEIKRLIAPLADAVWAQGEKFGTIGCQIGDRPYEITTHRAESYNDASRKPEVQFGDDLGVDLSRRDFTVNAMAIRLSDGLLVDPFGGSDALTRGVLQTPVEPEVSFSDDPLRILRAARFIARYGLLVDPLLRTAASSLSSRMSIVSVERIREELDKLLAAPSPSSGLTFLADVGAWRFVSSWIAVDQLEQIGNVLDRSRVDVALRRAIVFSHAAPGDRARQLEHLKYSNAESRSTRLVLAGLDLVSHGGQDFEPTTVRRLVDRVKFESMPVLLELIEVLSVRDRGLSQLFAELSETEDLSDLSPALSGEDIMDLLGIDPGPEVGAALGVLQERRFEDGPLERADEVAFLLQKYRRR